MLELSVPAPFVVVALGVMALVALAIVFALRDRTAWRKTRIRLLESKVEHQAKIIGTLRKELRDTRWRANAYQPKGDI